MDAMAERLQKFREERIAREKARLEKLRELNRKKYNKPDEPKKVTSSTSIVNKSLKTQTSIKNNTLQKVDKVSRVTMDVRKPLTAPLDRKTAKGPAKKLFEDKKLPNYKKTPNNQFNKSDKKPDTVTAGSKPSVPNNLNCKSLAPIDKPKLNQSRKSLAPTKTPQSASKNHTSDVEKLRNNPKYLQKVIRTSGLILNKRHTVFDIKTKVDVPVRRSISAVHLKRISKNELGNRIHKWASIGDKINNLHLKHINEDEKINEDKVVSAIKSERKRVTFLTPMPNLNSPRPEELEARLKSWLQKRGKSFDSYLHLQCFGIHHLPHNLQFDTKVYDDENKENIPKASDSDNDSYTENTNEETENVNNKWRNASIVSESVDFNESQNTTPSCSSDINISDVVTGALNDLTELLKEGFEWQQCARWLRAVRERVPAVSNSAAYWECRAALEERRGDMPASVQCWEEAIVKGTKHSVVEANLDQLLDQFMQLKISPNSCNTQQVDPKLLDAKNVFKSTIIRFAVQQNKLRQSNQSTPSAKLCVTPVRRSGRLSVCGSSSAARRRPLLQHCSSLLQHCSSLRHAEQLAGQQLQFVPNQNLPGTP